MKLCGLVPNFHIHVSVSDFYIPWSVLLFCCGKKYHTSLLLLILRLLLPLSLQYTYSSICVSGRGLSHIPLLQLGRGRTLCWVASLRPSASVGITICYQIGQAKGLLASCTVPKIWNIYSQKWNCAVLFPISMLMYLWAIYIFPWSVLGLWEYINRSQIYECENWETEYYKSVLEIDSRTVSFHRIHKSEPDIYIGFSPALHLQSGSSSPCISPVVDFQNMEEGTYTYLQILWLLYKFFPRWKHISF
jgi:hypothetical protein